MHNTNYTEKRRAGKKWVGIVFLIIGLIMLSRQLGFSIPHWVTSWPMLLIIIGLITGRKQQFRNPGSYVLILIGGIFLLDKIFEGVDLHDFAIPVVIMGIGLYLIVGRRQHTFNKPNPQFQPDNDNKHDWDKRVYSEEADPIVDKDPVQPTEEQAQYQNSSSSSSSSYANFASDDYLDTVSVFGGVKKNIVSKNFRGGEITTIMGGAEINFIQADIHGRVILDVTQLFGGTKIIVPQQWKVSSEMVALFGGIEDRRPIMHGAVPSEDKVLVIKGTSIFGGIDIRSF